MTLNERMIWAATFANVMATYEYGPQVGEVVIRAIGRAEFNVLQFRWHSAEIQRKTANDIPVAIPKQALEMLAEMNRQES